VPAVTITERVADVLPILRAYAAEVDRDARFPVECLEALRTSGLLGLLVPTRYGGLGGGLAELVEVAKLLAGACTSTAMIWVMHCQQVDALVRFASPPLRESLLPKIAAGDVYVASVTTEPGKGGYLFKAEDALEQGDSGWRLDRRAPIVTGGQVADGFLVSMRGGPDAPPSNMTLIYAERDQLAVTLEAGSWDSLGMRATHSVSMRLRGEVPEDQIVGPPGQFRRVALDSFVTLGHLGWAASWIGAARHAFEAVVRLYGKPEQPSNFDVQSDHFTSRLGRIRVDLEVANAYLGRTVEEISGLRRHGGEVDRNATQIHLNTLKIVAAERSFAVVDQLIDLVGLKLGYRRDSPIPLERLFRDLRSASLNHSNDRLLVATGRLGLLDRNVELG
jgi:acyl-CoA dehydrogenase